MADVFISYAQAAAESAKALEARLRRSGFSTWIDSGLEPGANFNDSIRNELSAAGAVVVVWSPEAAASEYVKMEAGIAWAWEKLLPVRLSDMPPAEIPVPFRDIQTIEIASFEAIVETLEDWGIGPTRRRKKLSVDEFFEMLDAQEPGLRVKLHDWRIKAEGQGFKAVFRQTLMFKSAIPGFQDVSFGTILPNGTVNTNYISDWSQQLKDPGIAAD